MENMEKKYVLDIKGMRTQPLTANEVLLQFQNEHESQGVFITIIGSENWIPLDSYLENLRNEAVSYTESVSEAGLPPKLKLKKNNSANILATDNTNQPTSNNSQPPPIISNLTSSNFNNTTNTLNPTSTTPPSPPTSNYKTSIVSIMMMGFIISVMVFGYLFFLMKQPVTGFIQNSNENSESLNAKYKIEILSEQEAFKWQTSVKPDLAKLSRRYKSTHEDIDAKILALMHKTDETVDKYTAITIAMLQARRSATILSIHFNPKSESDNLELRKLESALDIVGTYLTQDVMTKLTNKNFTDLAGLIRKSGFETIKKKAGAEIEELGKSIDLILNEAGPIVDDSDNLLNTKLFLPSNEFEREDVTSTNMAGEFKLNLRPGRYIIYISPKNDIQEIKIPKYWAKQILVKSMSANKIIVQENEQGTRSPLSVWSNTDVKSLKINHEKLKLDVITLRGLKKEIEELTLKIERIQNTTVKLD
jgi:hypothetical protein